MKTSLATEPVTQPRTQTYTEDYTSWDNGIQPLNDDFSDDYDVKTLLKKPAGTKRDARLEKLSDAAEKERECFGDPHLAPGVGALHYFDNFSDVLPECLRRWDKLLDRKAFRNRGIYEPRWNQFFDPYFYSLDLADLNISKKVQRRIDRARAQRPDLDLNNPLQIKLNAELLKGLVLDNLDHGACWIKLEGTVPSVHLHIIAERLAIRPDLKRSEVKQSGKVTPVYYRQGMVAYLLKPTFTVKNYDPDDPAKVLEGVQKMALAIAAQRVNLAAGRERTVLFQFYKAQRPIPIPQYSEAKKDAATTPVSVPLPATARPLQPQKSKSIATPLPARPADDPPKPHPRL